MAEQVNATQTANGNAPTIERPLVDPFDRRVSYLRLSVTDRCDFRCTYCMAENMTFLPKKDILSLEELDRLAKAFIARGIDKIRLTGGEPLVRKNIVWLIESLGARVGSGLQELTITTNGSQLTKHAEALHRAGVRRVNVSLDSLNAEKFQRITRWGRLAPVLDGIEAAQAAGLAVKINMVALKGVNEDEIEPMLAWCGRQGLDLTLIETMPMGSVDTDRLADFLPLSQVRATLERGWTLTDLAYRTGGPARYVQVEETGQKLGFITPMTHNFCESCNRVRVTCTGRLFMCLGQDDEADLMTPLRHDPTGRLLDAALDGAIARKPKGHDFVIDRPAAASVGRTMSMTGG